MKFGIVVFPGSNCDHDAWHAVKHVMGQDAVWLWHKDESLQGADCVILPGGFSYGDYLRSGAIARFSPVMKKVVDFARGGGLVLGICNGFQILLEAGLLPGAMRRNRELKFVCEKIHLRLENNSTAFTNRGREGAVLKIPIAHMDGNYYADAATLDAMERRRQVVFRYCAPDGSLRDDWNPNGSERAIAGIVSEAGNVMGLMPHPERVVEALQGGTDGRLVFESLIAAFEGGRRNVAAS
jgi:phosphoribosylformylglycinamidine synthase